MFAGVAGGRLRSGVLAIATAQRIAWRSGFMFGARGHGSRHIWRHHIFLFILLICRLRWQRLRSIFVTATALLLLRLHARINTCALKRCVRAYLYKRGGEENLRGAGVGAGAMGDIRRKRRGLCVADGDIISVFCSAAAASNIFVGWANVSWRRLGGRRYGRSAYRACCAAQTSSGLWRAHSSNIGIVAVLLRTPLVAAGGVTSKYSPRRGGVATRQNRPWAWRRT